MPGGAVARAGRGVYARGVLVAVRIALQVVLVFGLLSVVIGVAHGDTPMAMRAALVVLGLVLLQASVWVRRIGARAG